MKYSYSETKLHIAALNNPGCLKNFNALIRKEGYDNAEVVFNENIIVIDMDCIELKNAKNENRNRSSSMDCAFAIEGDFPKNMAMLMVELRFNYKSLKNLDKEKLLSKVRGTKKALGSSVAIHNDYIFIFNTNLKAQAKSWFFRRFPGIPKNYKVMDINELNTVFF